MTTNNHTGSSQPTEKNAMNAKSNKEQVEKFLMGVTYPTEKKHILEHAKKNNAPKNIMDELSHLADQKYLSQNEVTKHLSH